MSTYWRLVEDAASQHADEVILADDAGRSLTAAGLRDAAVTVAAGLWESGVRPGQVLSWQLPTILEVPVLMAACARLGVVQNPIIPLLRHREVGFILDQLAARAVIVPESWRGFAHAAMVREVGAEARRTIISLNLDGTSTSVDLRLPIGDPGCLPEPPDDGQMCRWIYYSSGTTGDPKGVRHSDSTVMASANGVVDGLELRRGEIYPIAWPFAHIGGVSMLSAVLRAGGRLVLFSMFDPAETPTKMSDHKPTILGSATPFFAAYVAAQRGHGVEPLFPELRACVAGGAPTPLTVNREVSEVLHVPGIVGAWGLTEFPVATSESCADDEVGTTSGRPAAGVSVRIVDGELQLKGPQCFLGYVDTALNVGAFDDDWFRTGDLGSVNAQGRVLIEGRLKDVIIRNAENVSALEVEEAILRHPVVVDAAVIGVPDERTGERVCAVVVAADGAEVRLSDLVDHCRGLGLARYKWPEQLQVVAQIPRNSMGKILKRDLIGAVTSEVTALQTPSR
jgi:acyl-CoA synthetase (AMP-forming)/AMP-acid ligase II